MDDPYFVSPYQKNSVTVTLRMFEESLRKALFWMDGGEEIGILYRRRLDVPEEVKAQARGRILQALELIQELADTFHLEVLEENTARHIKGDIFIDWENLSDIRADRLKGFGAPKEGLSAVLDPPVDMLCRLALQLGTMFERAAAGANGSTPSKENSEP